MAKKGKGARIKIGLVCKECKKQNYVTEKNRLTTTEKIHLRKYCPLCKKHTIHIEKKKL